MPDDQQELLFAPRFLEQHAGSVLRDPATALIELVANSWDAGATEVRITWPDESTGTPFQIADNGHGMTDEQFSQRWRTLSYDRREQQGTKVEFPDDGMARPARPAFGRNGIGRHGILAFADEYRIDTWRDGVCHSYNVRRGRSSPLLIDPIGSVEKDGHGTVLEALEPRYPRLSAEQAKTEIGLRFLTDPAFAVFVDRDEVEIADVPADQLKIETVSIADVGEFTIRLLDTRTTDRTAKQHGVAWHVNGRLVGECSWSGTGHERFLDGRTSEAKRYTFIVEADPLQDSVRPDWSGFREDDSAWVASNEVIQGHIASTLLELTQEKRAEVKAEIRRRSAPVLGKIGPKARAKWDTFVDRAQVECPSVSDRDLAHLADLLAKLELSSSEYGLVDRLSRLEPGHLDDLHDILHHWTVETAKTVLDELKGRLSLLKQIQEKVLDPATDEVQELQPLFEQGLWIFGPEFETIEFTSNRGMTTVIQQLFGQDDLGSRRRPDFAVLPDGSSGLYSYPSYDYQGGESGVARLVIVELKRPGVTVGLGEKNQAWKYAKELMRRGHISQATSVTCFVLGSALAPNEEQESRHGPNVVVQPMLFDTVVQRAKSRLLRLYDRVRHAPFLEGENVGEFLDSGEGPDLFSAAAGE